MVCEKSCDSQVSLAGNPPRRRFPSSRRDSLKAMEYEQTKAASTVLEPEVVELVHYFKIGDRLGLVGAGWGWLGMR